MGAVSGKWAYATYAGIDYCLFYLAEIMAFVCAKLLVACTLFEGVTW